MNELEKHVLEMIGENVDSPDVFTESNIDQIRDSINDAIEEITIVTGSVTRRYRISIRANANFYRLDFSQGRIAWITNVWLYGVNRRLDQTDFVGLVTNNPRWLYNSGSPTTYFTVGENIFGIHPAPTSSSGQIEINSVVIPDRYQEDIDRVKLRESFKWATVHFAVGEYYASRGDAKQAMSHHTKYLKQLGISSLYPDFAEKVYQYKTHKTPGGAVDLVRP